jgi:hypothetical protein
LVRHEDVVVRLPRVRRPQLEHELLALQVDHKVILGDILSRQSNVKWLSDLDVVALAGGGVAEVDRALQVLLVGCFHVLRVLYYN